MPQSTESHSARRNTNDAATAPGAGTTAPPARHLPVAVRYELAGAAGQGLPHVRRTLRLGEAARAYAMGRCGRLFGGNVSAALSGHEGAGPARGHRHAFFLPTDEDNDGAIDHLTVYAAGGFDDRELKALQSLSLLAWGRSGALRLELLGFLLPEELARVPAFAPSARWHSVTPMVLYRRPKKYRRGEPKLNEFGRQIDGPEDQLHREWGYRQALDPDLPGIAAARLIPARTLSDGTEVHWLAFVRKRRRETAPVTGLAFGFEVEFEKPVPGPVAVGYGAHFGLGLFAPLQRS